MAFTPEYRFKAPAYKSLVGLTEKQIEEHLKLYQGYVNKSLEIFNKLKQVDRKNVAATYSDFRELKLEQTFNMNGMYLHQLYFENLAPGGQGQPSQRLLEFINRDFGSFEAWQEDFVATGLVARGWSVLVLNLEDGHLYNFLFDSHNIGGLYVSVPLLVLDVFEHAYFIDYGTNRRAYIDTFMKNINWDVVNRRFDKALRMRSVWIEQ